MNVKIAASTIVEETEVANAIASSQRSFEEAIAFRFHV